MKHLLKLFAGIALCVASAAAVAEQVVLTFDGTGYNSPEFYTEDGFRITTKQLHIHFMDVPEQTLFIHDHGCCSNYYQFSRDDGALFTLLSFDLYENNVGMFFGTDKADVNLTIAPGQIGHVDVSNFANIAYFTWSVASPYGDGQASIDNITFADPAATAPTAAVPEPGSVALLGLALLGLFAARRKSLR